MTHNNKNRNDENRYKREEIYYLSYFLTKNIDENMPEKEKDKIKTENRDKNKVKKFILPLLITTVENNNFSDAKSTFKKDFSIIIKNKFEKLPFEYKKRFIKEDNVFIIQKVLEEKIDNAFKDASIFLRDFRNIMMHKNVKTDTFLRCKFNNFYGELFTFLMLCIEADLQSNNKQKDILKEKNKNETDKLSSEKFDVKNAYINKILEMKADNMKENFANVPFIYALSILAMFTESKYIKEVLDTIKLKRFIEDFILSFSLRGGYKTFVPGISLEDDELYLKQLEKRDEINRETANTGKRLIKKLDYFDINNNKTIDDQFSNYKKILRFYSYRNSFPKIDELEDLIRVYKAKELVESNKDRMKGNEEQIKNANINNYRIKNGGKGTKLQVNQKLILETDYKKIVPTLTNVFRNDDIFIREACEFLSSKYYNEFGNETWSISGNAIIWLEPNDDILFDARKKVKPSKNGLNSIYKILYNKANADKYSLNRYNLRALITSILITGGLDFKKLKNTASNSYTARSNTRENTNNKTLSDDLKEKSVNWNRHKQASFVIKVIRRKAMKDKHLHNRDSIAFFQEFIRTLYVLDNREGNIYNDAIAVMQKYGVDTRNVSDEVKNLLKCDTLSEMLSQSFNLFTSSNKKRDKKYTNLSFKTWTKFAFLPCNEKNTDIINLLRWNEIKNKFNIIEKNADLFDILVNVFKNEHITMPPIVDIYYEYIKNAKINKYRNKEIRNIIAEEMILSYISLKYVNMISKDKLSYFKLESYEDKKDNTPLKFNLVWDLNPLIKINIKEYMKKDVRSALNWIFDAARIKDNGKINGKEDLQKCLTNAVKSYNIIINHNILKHKCPKHSSEMHKDVFTADNIKDIVKVLVWAQKELLYFICNIESDIIYTMYNIGLTEHEINQYMEDEGYFNFTTLVKFHNNNINKIKLVDNHKNNSALDIRITNVRNMLAHGRLFDESSDLDYNKAIDVLDDSLIAIWGKSLKVIYNNIRVDFASFFNSIKNYTDKQEFINLINEAKAKSKGKELGEIINSINIEEKNDNKSKFLLKNLKLDKDLCDYLINFVQSKLKDNKNNKDFSDYCNLLLRTNFKKINENNNLFPFIFILIIIKDYVDDYHIDLYMKKVKLLYLNSFLN